MRITKTKVEVIIKMKDCQLMKATSLRENSTEFIIIWNEIISEKSLFLLLK